ncbi:MAG: LuxR C-terminal-related transcriptional regulator [Marmoricola sp.]
MPTLRVVVAEDSLLVRAGIQMVIERDPDLDLVGAVEDVAGLRALVAEAEPDVVVTDVRMPPAFSDEGIQVAVELRATHPSVGVVVLSQYAEPAYAQALLGGGSAGRAYLLKERISEPGQLTAAIRAVAGGGSIVDLLVSSNVRHEDSGLSRLSERELQVLDQVAQGKSNAAVAASLFLTERTVEKHINAVFGKLELDPAPDVNRRVAAVLLHLSHRA